MARGQPKKRLSRFKIICLSAAGFFALGYVPTFFAKAPVISMTAATCLVIPFGSRCKRLWQAVLWGVGLGLAAGAGIFSAWSYGAPLEGEASNLAMIYVAATTGMCLAAAMMFCYVAEKRRRMLEEGWK